ncbi:MAG TPA: 2-dehydropantoate 2-reductase N-terminal domain-containing protein [Kofleriaceae bacterium]|nr:2-dehydropantoate 2-reductase N-terminal domain-containing protein [Kofleriaceae bacterium]
MTARADTVGIVGAGGFGTGLAIALARAGRPVALYTRTPEVAEAIRTTRRCPRLSEVQVPASVQLVTDVAALAAAARFLVIAVTSTDVGGRLAELGGALDGNHLVVHAIGGLAAPEDTRVTELIERLTPALRVGVLAGPALPLDLAHGQFASMVLGSTFAEVLAEGRRLFNLPPGLRLYTSTDVVGVELSSALAGAYTVALGLADGLHIGPGPRAVLVTRAIAEASRLVAAQGGQARTMSGLAGLGNLLVRAGTQDPDHQLGLALARGEPVDRGRMTEGARAALSAMRVAARRGIHTPVLTGVAAVLTGKASVADAPRLVADTVAAEE